MKKTVLLFIGVLVGTLAMGQANQSPCPALKNPATFTAGSTSGARIGYYTGQTGTKPYTAPNALQGITGVTMTSAIIPATQLASQVSSGSSYCGSTLEPQKRFRIMSSTEGPGTGSQRGKDPLVNYSLTYVPPTQPGEEPFTTSIRLGNCYVGAEAEALYYNMKVSMNNALLFIYYAIVEQAPTHGETGNPSFVIRVARPQGSNYVQISDTLCYAITSASLTNGVNGWHSFNGPGGNGFYRDWNKVAVNLNKYMYETVRLEIYMGDCAAHGHYGYCYVAGDCQQMAIGTSGCPRGATTTVDTMSAPKGLTNYVWYRSTVDGSTIANLQNISDDVQFVRISPATDTNNTFACDTSHFRVHLTTQDGRDSMGLTNNQVFRCDMTSAMDPAKPFISKVYVRVMNTKPICAVDTVKSCESTISLINKSYVPNLSHGCDTMKTKWWFYSGSNERTPLVDSIEFDPQHPGVTRGTAYYRYPANTVGIRAVRMRSYSSTSMECYTDQTYPIRILGRPEAHVVASTTDLCDSDVVTLTDMTEHSVRRDWIFRRINGSDTTYDTIMGPRRNCPQTYSRGFTEYENPVVMRTYNGDYCRDSVNTYDTIWCTSNDTVVIHTFSHPDLYRDGDSVVCKGDRTDITIWTPTDSCTFKWYRTLYGTQPIASGDRLQVQPYADTSVYYVKVTSPKQCVAWDSVYAYMVIPTLSIDKTIMCDGDSVMLHSGAADHYSWLANPPDATLDALLDSLGHGPSDILVKPRKPTTYTLIGHGTNGCNADPLTASVDVHALPVARISVDPSFIDSDRPEVTFSDVSPHSVHARWYFPNEELPLDGSPLIYNFGEVADSTVPVTLVAYNDLGCSDTTSIDVPVVLFTYYAPNVFTPERADNNRFSIFTTNEMEHFHITVYDRRGQMVFRSDDLHFEWDGTRMDGEKCPQGTYVFVVTYRRPNTEDIVTQKGAVTLVR